MRKWLDNFTGCTIIETLSENISCFSFPFHNFQASKNDALRTSSSEEVMLKNNIEKLSHLQRREKPGKICHKKQKFYFGMNIGN